MVPLLSAAGHGFSANLSPRSGGKKYLLHPILNVLYSRSNVGDDMAECKQEKQGMFSAYRFLGHAVVEKFLSRSI